MSARKPDIALRMLRQAREDLHEEVRGVDAAFSRHLRAGGDKSVSDQCVVCNAYRERIGGLNFAIVLLGGRPRIDYGTVLDE